MEKYRTSHEQVRDRQTDRQTEGILGLGPLDIQSLFQN
jgi:hypothetical protein